MNQPVNPTNADPSGPTEDPIATCDDCGASGAFVFGHIKLCLRCYTEKGSCCAESGIQNAERLTSRSDERQQVDPQHSASWPRA